MIDLRVALSSVGFAGVAGAAVGGALGGCLLLAGGAVSLVTGALVLGNHEGMGDGLVGLYERGLRRWRRRAMLSPWDRRFIRLTTGIGWASIGGVFLLLGLLLIWRAEGGVLA